MADKHEISDTLEVGQPQIVTAQPPILTPSTHIVKVLGGSHGAIHYEHGFNIAATKASAISCGMSEHLLDWYTNDR
jgi:hypothetical protein